MKEIKQNMNKGSKGVLYTPHKTFTLGKVTKKKQLNKRKKTSIAIVGVGSERRQITTISNVEALLKVNMEMPNPLDNVHICIDGTMY